MIKYRYGGKHGRQFTLATSDELVAVRTHSGDPVMESQPFEAASLSGEARMVLSKFDTRVQFAAAGVSVLQSSVSRGSRALRDKAREILKKEPDIRFAGRVMCEPKSGAPVLYTENLFVKFDGDLSASACRRVLKKFGLEMKRELEYARNAWFAGAPEGTGVEVFSIAEELLRDPSVELCHPELVREVRSRRAFPDQWHLKKTTIGGQSIDAHASVEAAWAVSEGENVIIAVVDDGVDLDHEELRSSGKIVAPRDVTRGTDNPRPGTGNNHGTACAGVACADGVAGASGVAPKARLMPIRLASGLGSQNEADAFVWAAGHGAGVISCSWGPRDGEWWNPSDPAHNTRVPLPDSTRLAIDFAIRTGRSGKGCVIVWAAGNGNESVDLDGYASYEKVIAVAACNDEGKKAAYSDFGAANWCAFPSSNGNPSRTSGIWTTDRMGTQGYNAGDPRRGDAAGNYTNSFGGTSSAAPGVAGVAALILSRNPELRWDEVRDILKRCCDRIDPQGGNYDAAGHSDLYGYGRVNAKTALGLAIPAQPDYMAIKTVRKDVPIQDLKTATLDMAIADTTPLKDLKVTVDIEHTYIGDLVVAIAGPASMGAGPVTLHSRQGAGADNLQMTYDSVNTPGLLAFRGGSPAGKWTLSVKDEAKQDTGRIRSVSLEMTL